MLTYYLCIQFLHHSERARQFFLRLLQLVRERREICIVLFELSLQLRLFRHVDLCFFPEAARTHVSDRRRYGMGAVFAAPADAEQLILGHPHRDVVAGHHPLVLVWRRLAQADGGCVQPPLGAEHGQHGLRPFEIVNGRALEAHGGQLLRVDGRPKRVERRRARADGHRQAHFLVELPTELFVVVHALRCEAEVVVALQQRLHNVRVPLVFDGASNQRRAKDLVAELVLVRFEPLPTLRDLGRNPPQDTDLLAALRVESGNLALCLLLLVCDAL